MNKIIGILNQSLNEKSIKKLEEKGFEIAFIPNLKPEKIELNPTDYELINALLTYDWLIFTDIFAVDYFIDELSKFDFDIFELDNLRICAYGEAVADRLRFSQIHSDIIPGKLSDEIILNDIKNYTASDNDMKCLTFLIIRGENIIVPLKNELEKISKCVTELSVYRVNFESNEAIAKTRILINGGAYDEIMFFSVEDLQIFKLIVGQKSFNELAQDINLVTSDKIVQKSIEELKF